jgi:hypothetical protein
MASSDCTEPLPPYAFVPGGRWPHPTSSPLGHSFRRRPAEIDLGDRDLGSQSRAFQRGVKLFNAGYYWEAHEVWEELWHAHGRHGAKADVFRALIKLAAAGVKVRERQEHGVRTHASRAAELFARARRETGASLLGLDLDLLVELAGQIAANPPVDPGPPDAPVVRVFGFDIEINPSEG